MKISGRISRLVIMSSLVLATLFATVANAEGVWNSYLSGAYQGFESRRWTDNHVDANSTYVYFTNCDDGRGSGLNTSVAVRLYRDVPFWPAEDRGMVRLYCWNSDIGYYGEQPTAGTFHWTLGDITGTTGPVNVLYVETGY